MDNHIPYDNEEHDAQLAAFVDNLLSDDDALLEVTETDQDLQNLQHMAWFVEKAYGTEQPSDAMTKRIKSRLVVEWNTQQVKAPLWQTLIDKLFPPTISGRRISSLAMAAAALLLVLFLLPITFLGGGESVFPGAGGTSQSPPVLPAVITIGALVIGGITLWFLMKED